MATVEGNPTALISEIQHGLSALKEVDPTAEAALQARFEEIHGPVITGLRAIFREQGSVHEFIQSYQGGIGDYVQKLTKLRDDVCNSVAQTCTDFSKVEVVSPHASPDLVEQVVA